MDVPRCRAYVKVLGKCSWLSVISFNSSSLDIPPSCSLTVSLRNTLLTTRIDELVMSTPGKKPSGGRPNPRRLFSLDNLKKKRTSSESDSASVTSDASHWRKQSNSSSNLLTLAEKIEDGIDPFANAESEAWTEKGVVQSPEDEEPPTSSEITPKASVLNARGKVPPQLDLGTNGLSTPSIDSNVPPSPSRRRWNTIRSVVVSSTSSVRSTSPPPLPTPPPEGTQVPSVPSTPRPSTPRGYRFGPKKSMRQVVDQVRDVTHDETRRLTEEIRKACLAVRFGEVPTRTKAEPVTQNTIGSTLHLPFLATAGSSVMTAGGVVMGHARQATGGGLMGHARQATGGGLKRPASVMSLGAASRAAPTVTHIARALTSSTSENRPRTLPCETQVLAALLVPFLGPHANPQIGTEQNLAAETYEYVIRTWKPASNEVRVYVRTRPFASHFTLCIISGRAGSMHLVLQSGLSPFVIPGPYSRDAIGTAILAGEDVQR